MLRLRNGKPVQRLTIDVPAKVHKKLKQMADGTLQDLCERILTQATTKRNTKGRQADVCSGVN